jgi:hypothetical protein
VATPDRAAADVWRRKHHHRPAEPSIEPRLTTAVVAAQVGSAFDRFQSAVQAIEPVLDELAEQQNAQRQQQQKAGE